MGGGHLRRGVNSVIMHMDFHNDVVLHFQVRLNFLLSFLSFSFGEVGGGHIHALHYVMCMSFWQKHVNSQKILHSSFPPLFSVLLPLPLPFLLIPFNVQHILTVIACSLNLSVESDLEQALLVKMQVLVISQGYKFTVLIPLQSETSTPYLY